MKAFTVCAALFLLLTVLVTTFAFLSGEKVKKLEVLAENAALCALNEQDVEAQKLFESLKKEWYALEPKLALTIHHSTIKPVRLAVTDIENAIVLQNREALYAALVRLSKELKTLADDIKIPSL